MKLLIIALLLSAGANAQRTSPWINPTATDTIAKGDTSVAPGWASGHTTAMGFTMGFSPEASIMFYTDGTIKITGDTLTAVNLAIEGMKKTYEREAELWRVIEASVKFSNTVSEYFKQSKQWKEYNRLLNKHGYIIVKPK